MFFKKKKFPYSELDEAISEIEYALKDNKSLEVREIYIDNAIALLKDAKEKLKK